MKRTGEISALTALAIVACVAIGAYAWLTWRKDGPPAWATDPGVAKGAVHAGEHVVLIDAVTSEQGFTTRVTVVDASNGKRGIAMEMPGLVGCHAAAPTRIWCAAPSVQLFDLPSLEPVTDPATLAMTPAAPVVPDASCATLKPPLGGHICESAALVGSTYVVTTTSPAARVLGINRATGAVRWTTGQP